MKINYTICCWSMFVLECLLSKNLLKFKCCKDLLELFLLSPNMSKKIVLVQKK